MGSKVKTATELTKMRKDELVKLIEETQNELKALEEEKATVERWAQYDAIADEIKAINDSFIRAGFSEFAAMELTKLMIQNAAIMNSSAEQIIYRKKF